MSDEEHLDIDPCDKDEPGESKAAKAAVKAADAKVAKKAADAKEKNFQDAIAEKAAKETAQKEIDTILAGLKPDQKAKLLAAQGVVASPGSILPRVKYDHAATLKSLVKNTESVRAFMEPLMGDYEVVVSRRSNPPLSTSRTFTPSMLSCFCSGSLSRTAPMLCLKVTITMRSSIG